MGGFQVPNFSGPTPSVSGTLAMPNFGGDGGGSNQYMNFPSMGTNNMSSRFGLGNPIVPMPGGSSGGFPLPQTPTPPGIVPPSTPLPTGQAPGLSLPTTASKAGGFGLQGGAATGPSLDPALTNMWGNFLQQQMGKGVMPFELSALLPTSGQATTPGTLTAPMTQLNKSLQDFFMGQGQGVTGVPGTSGPLSYVLPMWQSEISAMNQPIQQQLANIKEQFGSQGALGSSEMAQAMANYGQQTALGEQNLLGQLTMQALPQQMAFGQMGQGLDQQAIQNMYQEFMRTQPQANPFMQDIQAMSTTFPPIYTKQGGIGAALAGQAGGLLGMAGGIGSSVAEGLSGGGGIVDVISSLAGLFCWLARATYGDSSWEARKIQKAWPVLVAKARVYRVLFALYVLVGEPLAKLVKRSSILRRVCRPMMDRLLRIALEV